MFSGDLLRRSYEPMKVPKMARNKSRPRKGRATKKTGKSAGAASTNANLNADASTQESPVIEGRAEEKNKKKQKTNPLEFFQQVRSEGEKVSWTGSNETMISTIMVLIMVLVMVVFFFIVDQVLRFGICSILPINCAT